MISVRSGPRVVGVDRIGVATFLMGLLPTSDTIGVWAPILLVILRFIQGIGVGGEWGTAW
jgi:MFS transporter, MHS family, shikimate and dehydroshikimate transport protein